jgi:mitochondrial chaperone BCS1
VTDLFANDLFSSVFAIGVIGTIATILRKHIALLFRRFYVEIDARDWDLVMWLGLWFSETDYGKRCRKLNANVLNDHEGEDTKSVVMEPGLGVHLFRYEGAWVLVNRQVEKEENVWNRKEWYSIRVLGSRDVATKLIETAKAYGQAALARRHTAFISDGKGEWKRLSVGAPRELASVILPGTMLQDIVERIDEFWRKRPWYAERGIPWRLGFSLDGPPGTGKTSVPRAIAHHYRLPLYVLDLAAKDFSNSDLVVTLSRLPARAVLVIEDMDVQLPKDRKEGDTLITLSGLLNALDGPLATEGRILFVTTNAKENLDGALLRAGRLDVHRHLGLATREQLERMFIRFFPGEASAAAMFAEFLPEHTVSPADVQEYLLTRCDDVERAITEAHLLARKEVRVVRREEAA